MTFEFYSTSSKMFQSISSIYLWFGDAVKVLTKGLVVSWCVSSTGLSTLDSISRLVMSGW